MNAQYEYHAGIPGHSIENCIAFKKAVERFIKMGIVKFENPSGPNVAGNPLPNLSDKWVNAIIENGGRRIKDDIAEIKGLEEGEVYASEEGPTGKAQNHPVVIISRPGYTRSGIQLAPRVIIQKPVAFSYKDSKKVPWNYDCNVTIPGEENPINASEEGNDVGFYTRSGKRYDPANTKGEPIKEKALAVEQDKTKTARIESHVNKSVTENEAREFLKFLKHSEYNVVEQLHKQLARISVLELLLSLETHRNALIKVLNETYVANDISVNKLDHLVNNINAGNFIFFNDDEIPPGGMGSTKALHITTCCKGHILPRVLIENGSALNVLPLSMLNRLPVDSSHMKSCQNIVRAFDGTERKVMRRIEIPLTIGPNTYEVDFLVIYIKPSYNYLLGRPWIHIAGAVPSTLHQKLKLGSKIPAPKISKATTMSLQLTMGKVPLPGRGLGRYLQGWVEVPILVNKHDHCGLGYKPDARERKKELEKKREKRRARLSGMETK
ncbi:uncharacterized protein LOC128033939 [Gossypium raimondii]|uniref:uncharacterized protein LOC128033939 n=1 Tax=Gossypium raimondii TaxID=29730 RepID=UPI00227A6C22|nr:uncharacterized protein LOC128033939 [Gossypium raimondii]